MYYTYVLQSVKNGKLCIGSTSDLKKRFNDHNAGKGGTFTKSNRPFKLIFYEAYINKKDALKSERFYKTGIGRQILKKKLENFFKGRSA